jgi:hypothetical protein
VARRIGRQFPFRQLENGVALILEAQLLLDLAENSYLINRVV